MPHRQGVETGARPEDGARLREVKQAMPDWYLEDIPVDQPMTTAEYLVTEEEMTAFARKWDPLPIHVDPEAASRLPPGGLTAPAIYTIAVCNLLEHGLNMSVPVIGAAEWKVRFPAPVRPGDRLSASLRCEHTRPSRTRPDRGIARFVTALHNQKGQRVLEWESTLLVLRRNPGPEGSPHVHG